MDRRSFLRTGPLGAAAAAASVVLPGGPSDAAPIDPDAPEGRGDPWYVVDYSEHVLMGEARQRELAAWLRSNDLPDDPHFWCSVSFWPGFSEIRWLESDASMDRYSMGPGDGKASRTTGLRSAPPRFAAVAMGL